MQQFNFERFEHQAGDFYFAEARFKYAILKDMPGARVVYWYGEEPNRFMSPDPAFRGEEYDLLFYKLLTVCPYTMEWMNKRQGANRRTLVYVPINEEKVPPKMDKKYDVIYIGNVNSRELNRIIGIIRDYNYRFVARSHNIGLISSVMYRLFGTTAENQLITDKEVTYQKKMELLAQTKVAVVHGLLWCSGVNLRAVWSTDGIEEHGAFALVPKKNWWRYLWSFFSTREYLVPQLKTRFVETAASRTLMLCRKDPFNIIERYYTPEEDFVYYEEGHLKETLDKVLDNWEQYEPMIERAYQKTMQRYTTQNFFEEFLKPIK